MNTVCYKPMFVLSPGGGLLNNLYIRAVWLNIYFPHTYCISRGLIKKLQLYGTNTNNVAAAAVAERGVYNRPVYFSISTPPSNWLIKQSYLAAERAARKRHAAAETRLSCMYSFCPRSERALHSQRGSRRIAALKYKLAAGKNTLAHCVWAICVFAYLLEFTLVLTRTHVLGICFFVVLMCGGGERKNVAWTMKSTAAHLNRSLHCLW